jgi:hypothetical protein
VPKPDPNNPSSSFTFDGCYSLTPGRLSKRWIGNVGPPAKKAAAAHGPAFPFTPGLVLWEPIKVLKESFALQEV